MAEKSKTFVRVSSIAPILPLFRGFCAGHAKRRGRIELEPLRINCHFAPKAISEFIIVYTGERCLYLLQHHFASFDRCLGHRLRLHGVHTGQAPNFGLIQLDDIGGLVCR